MKVTETKILGVYIVEPAVFGDNRGWFMESYSKIKTPEIDCTFVQDNHSYTAQKGVLRGIHCQKGEHSQAKLVRCVRGAVLDVAVDLREGSPTYCQWVAVELSDENKKQLFLPRGFGHGFITLSDDVEFLYKTDQYYNGESDCSILYNDPLFSIDWGISNPQLSEKDEKAPLFSQSSCHFTYGDL